MEDTLNRLQSTIVSSHSYHEMRELGIEQPIISASPAHLPWEEIEHTLSSHALIKNMHIPPKEVYNVLIHMIKRTPIYKAEHPKFSADATCRCCGMINKRFDYMMNTRLECAFCGHKEDSYVVNSDPYRMLEGKADRTHFSDIYARNDAEVVDLIDHFSQFINHGYMLQDEKDIARNYISAYKRSRTKPNEERNHKLRSLKVAVAAALIIVENPNIENDLKIGPKTQQIFTPLNVLQCNVCNQAVSRHMDKNTHCKLKMMAIQKKRYKYDGNILTNVVGGIQSSSIGKARDSNTNKADRPIYT